MRCVLCCVSDLNDLLPLGRLESACEALEAILYAVVREESAECGCVAAVRLLLAHSFDMLHEQADVVIDVRGGGHGGSTAEWSETGEWSG